MKKNNKWGYVDNNNTIVISFIYDEAYKFENGKARVKLKGRTFYIDRNGREVK